MRRDEDPIFDDEAFDRTFKRLNAMQRKTQKWLIPLVVLNGVLYLAFLFGIGYLIFLGIKALS